jgi:N-acetylated-alpha-linked acidic dipeptidase
VPYLRAAPSPASPQITLEHQFDAAIDIGEMRDWLKRMSSEPNHVGSPHDRTNAEWEVAEFTKFGWDAHIEKFEVVYPTALLAKTVGRLVTIA